MATGEAGRYVAIDIRKARRRVIARVVFSPVVSILVAIMLYQLATRSGLVTPSGIASAIGVIALLASVATTGLYIAIRGSFAHPARAIAGFAMGAWVILTAILTYIGSPGGLVPALVIALVSVVLPVGSTLVLVTESIDDFHRMTEPGGDGFDD